MIIEETADSWEKINELLFSDTYDPSILRHRSTYAYRGVSNESYKLINSLTRLGNPYPMMEENLLKQFKKYAHRDVVEKNTDWHWLSVAQHYGLPTRLLDWTYSPMIALHFATCDIPINPVNDAAVWRINYSNVHDKLQTRQTDSLRALGARIFSVDSLAETMPDLTELTGHGGGGYETAVFFEPPALDDRIINQFAYFSAISDPFLAFDDWLADPNISPDVNAMKVIIPHDLLWQVRDKLDQSNINERVLMTGLDGLCSWLRRHYTPRK